MLRLAQVLILLSLLLSTGSARAGSVQIDFDFTGSSVQILGGIIGVPPDGTITAASASVTVPGSSQTSISAGSATLSNLTLAATISATVISQATVSGSVAANQVPGGSAMLTAGLANLIFNGVLVNVSAPVNCTSTGPQCGFLGLPINLTGTFPLSGTFPIASIGTPGNAVVSGAFPITASGISALINLVGVEVSRTFVPEPNSASLLALGFIGLAAAARRARRHRHS